MGTVCDVPEQVLFDILLYLPVISLLRFKTVCKSWCSIIESSVFVTQHLKHNSEKGNLIVLRYNGSLSMLSGRKYELSSNLDFECIYPMPHSVDAVNSCNGIVCLAHRLSRDYWRLSLWNPATKQVRQLPQSSFLDPSSDDRLPFSHAFAFGFDVKTNDYKVVAVSLDSKCFLIKDSLVQVYSMRSDSWRTIHRGDDFPVARINYLKNVACNHGMCLWIGRPNLKSAVIFYVDLMDEVCGTMSLPNEDNDVQARSLAFVKDKVIYVKSNWGETRHSYEIWTMNEFGVNESWSRVYKLDDPLGPCDGVSFVKLLNNGEFILTNKHRKDNYHDELCLLDVVSEEEKFLNVHDARTVISCCESLVSIKRTT